MYGTPTKVTTYPLCARAHDTDNKRNQDSPECDSSGRLTRNRFVHVGIELGQAQGIDKAFDADLVGISHVSLILIARSSSSSLLGLTLQDFRQEGNFTLQGFDFADQGIFLHGMVFDIPTHGIGRINPLAILTLISSLEDQVRDRSRIPRSDFPRLGLVGEITESFSLTLLKSCINFFRVLHQTAVKLPSVWR